MKHKIRKIKKYKDITRAGDWHWINRRPIKQMMVFDKKLSTAYIYAISAYKVLPFSTHNLWIEYLDDNHCRLMAKWNTINSLCIHDLKPFWDLYDHITYELGLSTKKPEFNFRSELINDLVTNYKYGYPITHKEKYISYRKIQSGINEINWWLKKQEKIKKRMIKNKTFNHKSTKFKWVD